MCLHALRLRACLLFSDAPGPSPPPPRPRRRRRTDRWRAKYELLHVVRTHMGQDDAHYGCVYQKEDGTGKPGAPAASIAAPV